MVTGRSASCRSGGSAGGAGGGSTRRRGLVGWLGGRDVLVDMKFKEEPLCLVNIKRIPGMSYIREEKGSLRIGALTPIREIETSPLVRQKLPLLWESPHQFASLPIRKTATLRGKVRRGSPP